MSDTHGSQYLLQRAVDRRPELLTAALRRSGALDRREAIEWRSPLKSDGYREYRDLAALRAIDLIDRVTVPLSDFWPPRGAVWDALGVTSAGRVLLVEAKAHIPELVSPGTKASPASRSLIDVSLVAARRHYAPKSRAIWSNQFFQYANRLAYQYWLRRINGLSSSLVFLYFTNAVDMDGPTTEEEWMGAKRLVHAYLGLPANLREHGVYTAFMDATLLTDAK
jgi:hypothetical protein